RHATRPAPRATGTQATRSPCGRTPAPAVVELAISVRTPCGRACQVKILLPLHPGDDHVLVVVRLARLDRRLDPALAQDEDAVCDVEELVDVGGDPERARAGVGELADVANDLARRADVDAERRLVQEHQ